MSIRTGGPFLCRSTRWCMFGAVNVTNINLFSRRACHVTFVDLDFPLVSTKPSIAIYKIIRSVKNSTVREEEETMCIRNHMLSQLQLGRV